MPPTDALADRILAVVRRIPRGRVATYGAVADAAGVRTARAVGRVLAGIDEGSRIPWHRVINAAGRISLPGDGGRKQRERLLAEGVSCTPTGRIDLKRYGWVEPLTASIRPVSAIL